MDQPPAVTFTTFADAWPRAIETEICAALCPIGAGKDFDNDFISDRVVDIGGYCGKVQLLDYKNCKLKGKQQRLANAACYFKNSCTFSASTGAELGVKRGVVVGDFYCKHI